MQEPLESRLESGSRPTYSRRASCATGRSCLALRMAPTSRPSIRHSNTVILPWPVLHQTADGPVVVTGWSVGKERRRNIWVTSRSAGEIARIVNEYGIREVLGDQYCAAVIKQYFDKLGIRFSLNIRFGAAQRAYLFGNLRHLLVQRKIELLDQPVLSAMVASA